MLLHERPAAATRGSCFRKVSYALVALALLSLLAHPAWVFLGLAGPGSMAHQQLQLWPGTTPAAAEDGASSSSGAAAFPRPIVRPQRKHNQTAVGVVFYGRCAACM